MKRALFILFSTAVAACSGRAAQTGDLESVQKAIAEAWNRHKSMTARMQMESHKTLEDAATDGTGEGTVEVQRKGDQYLQRTEARTSLRRIMPEERVALDMKVTIILDGEGEYLIRESGGQKFYAKIPVNPGISVVPPIVIEFMSRSAELKVLPEQTIDGRKVYVIEAVRSAPNEAGAVRNVAYFLQDSGAVLKTEGYDAANAKTESITYSDFQFDQDLDPQRFVFEPPPGATVVDRTKKRTTTQATQPGEPDSQPASRPKIVGPLPGPTSQPASAPASPEAPKP